MGHAHESALFSAKANALATPSFFDMAHLDLGGAELVLASGPSSHSGRICIVEVSRMCMYRFPIR